MVSVLFYRGVDLCNLTLTDPHVKALFNQSYDLVIVDVFGTESLIGLGQIFHAPVIGFSAYSTARWTNMSPLSYKSHFPDWLPSLFYRLHNIIFYNMYESIVLAYSHHPLQVTEFGRQFHKIECSVLLFQRTVYDNAFPNVESSYDEARANVAITFVNSHPSLTVPMRNVCVMGLLLH